MHIFLHFCVRDSTNASKLKRLVTYGLLKMLSVLRPLPQKDTFQLQVSVKISRNG